MVFALLTEVVEFYMQITIIKIEISQFEEPINIVTKTC